MAKLTETIVLLAMAGGIVFAAVKYLGSPKKSSPTVTQTSNLDATVVPPVPMEEDVWQWPECSRNGGWSNWDTVTDRHRGRGTIGFVDGHAELRRFWRSSNRSLFEDGSIGYHFKAWFLFYQLRDDRIVTAGPWWDTIKHVGQEPDNVIRMGYLFRAADER